MWNNDSFCVIYFKRHPTDSEGGACLRFVNRTMARATPRNQFCVIQGVFCCRFFRPVFSLLLLRCTYLTCISPAGSVVDDCRISSSLAFHPSDPFLPPCRVCGEKASGFHYGVNTCEACKVRVRASAGVRRSFTFSKLALPVSGSDNNAARRPVLLGPCWSDFPNTSWLVDPRNCTNCPFFSEQSRLIQDDGLTFLPKDHILKTKESPRIPKQFY